jgi:hypothetical protein
MAPFSKLMLLCGVLLLCLSCTSTAKKPAEPDAATSSSGHDGDYVDYAGEWAAFQSAMAKKDLDHINAFIQVESLTAQNLMDMCPPEFYPDLARTAYADLKETDYDGIGVKEYSYQETGVDEEGNEVGMGLFFYFQEKEEGLRLVGFLAAG